MTVVALVAGGCATLESVDHAVCGNRVVEPGEDCDGDPEDPTLYLCGARDAEHACRYVWETDPAQCPDGAVASSDKRCRKPSGTYAYQGQSFELPGTSPQAADVDGDGVTDVGLFVPNPDIFGLYGELEVWSVAGGSPSRLAQVPSLVTGGGGDLSDDGLGDFVTGGNGVSVLRARNGALELKFYANKGLGEYGRFAQLPSWIDPGGFEHDLSLLGLMVYQSEGLRICVATQDCGSYSILLEGIPIGAPAGLDWDAFHIVGSAVGMQHVFYSARQDNIGGGPPELSTLPLAGGAVLASLPHLADVTGDGLDDLVAIGAAVGQVGLYVLEGRPPEIDATYPAWNATDTLELWLVNDLPLAYPSSNGQFEAARINSDDISDFATPGTVLLSRGNPLQAPVGEPPGMYVHYREHQIAFSPGNEAIVGDVDDDGLDDIAVQEATLGTNAPPLKLHFGGDTLPLVAIDIEAPGFLTKGGVVDFDGDGAEDLFLSFSDEIFAPDEPRSCEAEDEIYVAYGQSSTFPEPLSSVGLLPATQQFLAGRLFLDNAGPLDAFGDVVVSARCDSESGVVVKNALMFGNSARLIASPYAFNPSDDDVTFYATGVFAQDVVAVPALDGTDTGGPPHADIVALGQFESTRAFVLPSWGDAELDGELARELHLPERFAADDAGGSIGFGSAVQTAGEKNLVAIATSYIAFFDDGTQSLVSEVLIQRVPDDPDEAPALLASFELPSLEAVATGTFVRLRSLDVNADGVLDYALVYGAVADDSLYADPVVNPDGTMGGTDPLVPTATSASNLVLVLSQGDAYDVVTIEGFGDTAGSRVLDVVAAEGRFVAVTARDLYAIDHAATTAHVGPLVDPWPGTVADAVIGDFNGDGLGDLLVLDGEEGHLVAQVPINP